MEVKDFFLKEGGLSISVRRIFLPRQKVVLILPGFFQSKDTRIFKSLQRNLSKFFDVFCVDMPGHGKSRGFFTFGAKQEELAFILVLNHLRRLYPRIGILAFSLSALVAINCLAQDQEGVSSLALVSSPSSFSKVEFRFYTLGALRLALRSLDLNLGVLLGFPFLKKGVPLENIKKINNIPILFLQGGLDPIIDKEHTFKLAQVYKGKKKVYIFPQGSHAEDLYRSYPQQFLSQLVEWFKETLDSE